MSTLSIPSKLMTAEEFGDWVQRPENRDWWDERVRGNVNELLPPGEKPLGPAIIVLSRHDHFGAVTIKIDKYLRSGVRQVWMIDPIHRDIAISRPGNRVEVLEGDDELTGDDVLPGFHCKVSDFFRMPGEQPPTS